MNKRRIRIELLKFDEKEDVKYRHFNTAIVSNYEELLDDSNRQVENVNSNDQIFVAFYSPQIGTFLKSQEHFDLWFKSINRFPVCYLYCLTEIDPFFSDKTIKENMDEKFKIDSEICNNGSDISFLSRIYNFIFEAKLKND